MDAVSQTTNVFLVDDHRIIRDCFRHIVEAEDGFSVCGEADCGEATLRALPDREADLATVDISMKEMDGIELTRRLKKADPALRILIVSMHSETRYIKSALEAGASGYLLKDSVHTLLPKAIREVVENGLYICDELQQKLNGGANLFRLQTCLR